MLLSIPQTSHRFGGLLIEEETKVVELDAGMVDSSVFALGQRKKHEQLAEEERQPRGSIGIPPAVLEAMFGQMAIIVPCKDESTETIEGVLSGIPHSCLVVLVSNSSRFPQDRYAQEVEMLTDFCRFAGYGRSRPFMAIHQKDPEAAGALAAAGMPEILDGSDGLVRNGKGEGMILGVALVAALCQPQRRFVGFVDADNQVPGAVNEYCKAYAAGFAMNINSASCTAAVPTVATNTMVRIVWGSKPKVKNGQIVYDRDGRSSRVANKWLNYLLADISGPDQRVASAASLTNIVVTGNAGEHAMDMDLALKLRLASGYAIEPFHFVDLLHQLATSTTTTTSTTAPPAGPKFKPVKILQIRTRNPHFHRPSDESHIQKMRRAALGAIYHYLPLRTPPGGPDGLSLGDRIRACIGIPPAPLVYPPIERLDMAVFRARIMADRKAGSFASFGVPEKVVQG
ncbi:mannosyl-3-phosphoglycerate synthase [Podospora appendiculata]|uniref:Mannosyl-3-phosphoglycerate synthase n=1 Tax=Podospora appendiculata TaxID=314037 RepID=A0AAE1C789_9PEZI|nr:mannosyl-3-phosphoglycerate synthase [Podospora appendiculata]